MDLIGDIFIKKHINLFIKIIYYPKDVIFVESMIKYKFIIRDIDLLMIESMFVLYVLLVIHEFINDGFHVVNP